MNATSTKTVADLFNERRCVNVFSATSDMEPVAIQCECGQYIDAERKADGCRVRVTEDGPSLVCRNCSDSMTIHYEVLLIGRFDGTDYYAVFGLEKAGLGQIAGTARGSADLCNTLARQMAHRDGCGWYGYAPAMPEDTEADYYARNTE